MKIIRGKDLQFIPASHENPADPGVLKKVLIKLDDLVPGRVQMINWAMMPVGKAFDAHYHEDMDEVFIIISGKAEIQIDEEKDQLSEGDAVVIPEGAIHIMKNLSTTPLLYIAIGISHGRNGKTVNV